jgi:hypothetical protein
MVMLHLKEWQMFIKIFVSAGHNLFLAYFLNNLQALGANFINIFENHFNSKFSIEAARTSAEAVHVNTA